jgi:hypothetical protein
LILKAEAQVLQLDDQKQRFRTNGALQQFKINGMDLRGQSNLVRCNIITGLLRRYGVVALPIGHFG